MNLTPSILITLKDFLFSWKPLPWWDTVFQVLYFRPFFGTWCFSLCHNSNICWLYFSPTNNWPYYAQHSFKSRHLMKSRWPQMSALRWSIACSDTSLHLLPLNYLECITQQTPEPLLCGFNSGTADSSSDARESPTAFNCRPACQCTAHHPIWRNIILSYSTHKGIYKSGSIF